MPNIRCWIRFRTKVKNTASIVMDNACKRKRMVNERGRGVEDIVNDDSDAVGKWVL